MAQPQLAFASARDWGGVDEPYLYHDPARPGFTALLTPGGDKRQRVVRLHELPLVLDEVRASGKDAYIAQNEFFKPNRRAVNCWRLTSCFVDLDTYKLDRLYGQPAEALSELLLMHCEDAKLPPPSVVVYSGRGLQAKWLLETPLPRASLPRWQALQNELGRRLLPIGADLRALDASRVLRLVGTVNSKSGDVVRVVHVQRTVTHGGALGPDGVVVYPFDSFFDELMPLTRLELASQRAALSERLELEPEPSQTRNARRPHAPQLQVVGSGRLASARRIIPSELAWDRLEDLRKLAQLRHAGQGLPSGQRNVFVFLGACFLASALVAPRFRDEVRELGREFAPTWSTPELESCVSSVQSRLEAASRGEAVSFFGQPVDPRYRFRNTTLVDWLDISDDELPHMRTIVTRDEAKRRDRLRKESARRAEGRTPRSEYLAAVQAKVEAARMLRKKGHSLAEIACELEVSRASAHAYCKT